MVRLCVFGWVGENQIKKTCLKLSVNILRKPV